LPLYALQKALNSVHLKPCFLKCGVYKCRRFSTLTTRNTSPCPAIDSSDTNTVDQLQGVCYLFLGSKMAVFLKWCFPLWRVDIISTSTSHPFWEVFTFQTVGKMHFLGCETLELSFEGISFKKKRQRGVSH